MKPLTVEQLKALKVDDWVWVVIPQDYENNCCFCYKADKGTYREILCKGSLGMELCLHAKWNCTFSYSDYGTKWLAYKNKEQAEAKGEIVELPCALGENFVIKDYGFNRLKVEQRRIVGYNFSQFDSTIYPVDEYGNWYTPDKVFSTKPQAEARLKELQEK